MKWLLHFLVSAVVALVGVALGIGALFLFFMMLGETDSAFVTWNAVTYLVAAVALATGAGACIKYAARVLQMADRKSPPSP